MECDISEKPGNLLLYMKGRRKWCWADVQSGGAEWSGAPAQKRLRQNSAAVLTETERKQIRELVSEAGLRGGG